MVKVIKDDLFKNNKDRVPVHCISADFAMGAGIAPIMAKVYNLRPALSGKKAKIGDVLYVNGCLNMITKTCVWHKPTLENFAMTLKNVKKVCVENNITRLVAPKLGCGLDGLNWTTVFGMIKDIFSDEQVDVLVCDYDGFKR